MSEFSARLKKLKGNWGKARKRDPSQFGGSDIPDGVYRMAVTGAELTESQSSGRLQIVWEYTVLEGESKGEVIRDYDGMETEDNLFFIQRKIERLGFDAPEDPSEVEEVLNKINKKKPKIRGRVKSKDDFTHVYINKLLEEVSDDEGPGSEGEPEPESEGGEPEEPEPEPEAAAEEPEPEPEPVPEGEGAEEVELQEGMKVSFPSKGKTLEGEILNFIENDTKARVKTDKGVYPVVLEKLTPVEGEGEPQEPEPEPAPPPRKPTTKPATKPKGRVRKVGRK